LISSDDAPPLPLASGSKRKEAPKAEASGETQQTKQQQTKRRKTSKKAEKKDRKEDDDANDDLADDLPGAKKTKKKSRKASDKPKRKRRTAEEIARDGTLVLSRTNALCGSNSVPVGLSVQPSGKPISASRSCTAHCFSSRAIIWRAATSKTACAPRPIPRQDEKTAGRQSVNGTSPATAWCSAPSATRDGSSATTTT